MIHRRARIFGDINDFAVPVVEETLGPRRFFSINLAIFLLPAESVCVGCQEAFRSSSHSAGHPSLG
eukprot:NODE_3461_length_926_cov_6130.429875_g1394_i8.p7 GENE.NODE_3461_length_926_cov_6130.429875_g1394_i8~~NODE_3461_length_926_cov_6130.429875_g1394_i8.p7  ORF type:complete len:66 (-),score=12.26 NODE_3461_length_926_cov_6130.429875_g1394_i8:424-621(-)